MLTIRIKTLIQDMSDKELKSYISQLSYMILVDGKNYLKEKLEYAEMLAQNRL